MSTTEAQELVAGREMDALIAERVFGRRAVRNWPRWDSGDAYGLADALPDGTPDVQGTEDSLQEGPDWVTITPDAHCCPELLPRYSTDIAAAWSLVERFQMTVYAPLGNHASGEYSNSDVDPEPEDRWRAEPAINRETSGRAVLGFGATAPEAICRAALLVAPP